MSEKLIQYLCNHTTIGDNNLKKISRCFQHKTVKRNTVLLPAGEICSELYFLESGCIRTYYITKQGQEKTRFVAFEGAMVTSLSSFIAQEASFEFVETVENCELYMIRHREFYRLLDEIPQWEHFYRIFLESVYREQNKKMEQLVTLSAKQRYAKMRSEHPDYFQRLSNKQLASYLDITQETLSRLKSS